MRCHVRILLSLAIWKEDPWGESVITATMVTGSRDVWWSKLPKVILLHIWILLSMDIIWCSIFLPQINFFRILNSAGWERQRLAQSFSGQCEKFSTYVQSACLIFVHLCSLHTIGWLGKGGIEVDEGEDVAHGIVHGARVKETHSNIHRCQCYLGPDLPKAADEFRNDSSPTAFE